MLSISALAVAADGLGEPDDYATAWARPCHLLHTGGPAGSPEKLLNFRTVQINWGAGTGKAQGRHRVSLPGTSFQMPQG